jgi:hypothetical protein
MRHLCPTLFVLVGALSGCGSSGSSGSNDVGCADYSGTYNGTWANSCQGTASYTLAIAQSGCTIAAAVPEVGSLQGTANLEGAAFSLTFDAPCSGSATGSLSAQSTADLSGTYSGSSACCPALSGSFSMVRQ